MISWKERLRAGGIHFGASALVAALAALLVFGLWYPYPYREISGGRNLFLLVVAVDVIIGPLITVAVFDRRKPMRELRRDLAVVVLLQLGALAYGLSSVAIARPVHLVFEIDRFRVVHGVDVPVELLGREPATLGAMPWTGPTLLAARPFMSSAESAEATIAALGGVQIGARPDFWQPYADAKPRVLQAARPVAQLKARFSARAGDIDAAIRAKGRNPDTMAYLPMVGRNEFWTAFVDPVSADVVAFLPLDPF
ncbi:MAG TPA: TfpX/TfpZ family type IV pilin accessory protein [Ramlibacter sp.]|nr:TfpX/TfpZ family type IV pilin accessory protein [Ramlibacter sp.]